MDLRFRIKTYLLEDFMRFFRFSDVLSALFLVAITFFATNASANAFESVTEKGVDLFNEVRTIVLILGGFGLIALAVLAIFGKIRWYWFAALAFGLLVVAIAGSIIDWITGTTGEIQDL